MNSIFRGVKYLFKGILKIILFIIRIPIIFISNATRILKFSIRTKISYNYIVLYILVCIITILFIVGGYFTYLSNELTRDGYKYFTEIKVAMEKTQGNPVELEKSLIIIMKDSHIDVLIQDDKKQILAVTTDNYAINHYEAMKNKNALYRLIPEISLVGYELLPRHYYFKGNYITFFYDISENIHYIIVICGLAIISNFFGIFIIMIFGGIKSKKVLKPIKQMTKSAQNINAKNLNMRIDVGEAKYELKDLALTINDMINRIQDSYDKQQRFVSDVSHELRTPISVINGYANMLDRWGKDNPEVLQESIDAIKNEASNMSDLVEKLLFLARHDRDTLKYEMNSFNLSKLVDEIVKETEMIDSMHTIHHSIDNNININGDINRIKQAVRIFVDNATKYTTDYGKISICLYKEGSYGVVSIKDSGVGISSKDLSNIFDRFYRADESRTKTNGGYGLGLSIAKIIIVQHGGKIKVRSKLGEGSEFIIYLPI